VEERKDMTTETTIRTEVLFEDIKFWDMGYTLIGGVDEVGRGPLAGPVVAACVILPVDTLIDGIVDPSLGIRDSKRLSPLKRERLYDAIMSRAIAVGIGRVEPEEIDRINILNAARKAMQQAVSACKPLPDCLLTDALELDCAIPQFPLIKGDIRSQAIAAASIIAKVTRDCEMVRWAEVYPQYGFEKHKGYGTKQHIESIKRFGLSPIHRRTFCEKFLG